jgi:hypothetical protein
MTIKQNERGNLVYHGDTFQIELFRYTDPDRLNLAHSSALYLGKPDIENTKRPLSIMKLGHALEVFRGESATFVYYNVSKQVYDHLVTYKTMQMRVAGGNRALVSSDFTMPTDKMRNPLDVYNAIDRSMMHYHELLDNGETPQVARSAMPINANMHPFKLQFNFQTLIESLFVQRIWEKGAQGLTVNVVKAMWELCHAVDPELWDTVYELYGPHVKEWKDAQKKLRRTEITVRHFWEEINHSDVDILDKPLEELIREWYGKKKSMWN